mmetsp:Transcript_29676/g.95346  ORF Transcript_29676/g.95346 Transcript_29676/m.95346 type:complete len:236 (-) Transcript_29676:1031-1738(-)
MGWNAAYARKSRALLASPEVVLIVRSVIATASEHMSHATPSPLNPGGQQKEGPPSAGGTQQVWSEPSPPSSTSAAATSLQGTEKLSSAKHCTPSQPSMSMHAVSPLPAYPGAGQGPHTEPSSVSVQLASAAHPPLSTAHVDSSLQPVSPSPRNPSGHAEQVKPGAVLVHAVRGSHGQAGSSGLSQAMHSLMSAHPAGPRALPENPWGHGMLPLPVPPPHMKSVLGAGASLHATPG